MNTSTDTKLVAYLVTSADARPELEAGISVHEEAFEADDLGQRQIVDSTNVAFENAPEGTWGVDPEADWITDFGAADQLLAQAGYSRTSDWGRGDGQWLSPVEPLAETPAAIVDRLNTYRGDNIWQDVIYPLAAFDADADATGDSDGFTLADGTTITYIASEQRWTA